MPPSSILHETAAWLKLLELCCMLKLLELVLHAETVGRLDWLSDMYSADSDWMDAGWQHIWQHG